MTGTYQWDSTYSGDGNNNAASDVNNSNEQVKVNPANPSLSTVAGGTVALGGITISGTKYLDLTGNGFSSDDTPLGGVTINLYMESNGSSGLQIGSGGDDAGRHDDDREQRHLQLRGHHPGHLLRAGVGAVRLPPDGRRAERQLPGDSYYTIAATAGHSYSGNNFDDFQYHQLQLRIDVQLHGDHPEGRRHPRRRALAATPRRGIRSRRFTLPSGSRPGVHPGESIPRRAPRSATPPPTSRRSISGDRHLLQHRGQHAEPYADSHRFPNTYYQIDFVCGSAINELEPNQDSDAYGPDCANILYTPQGRLITSDNGGTTAP